LNKLILTVRLKSIILKTNVRKKTKNLDQEIVSTNGNRYDVNLIQRTHVPIYWIDKPNEVRRSKWFYSSERDSRFIPFDEQMNEQLEVKIFFI